MPILGVGFGGRVHWGLLGPQQQPDSGNRRTHWACSRPSDCFRIFLEVTPNGLSSRRRPRTRRCARASPRSARRAHQRESRPGNRAQRGGGQRPGAHRRPLRRHRHHRRDGRAAGLRHLGLHRGGAPAAGGNGPTGRGSSSTSATCRGRSGSPTSRPSRLCQNPNFGARKANPSFPRKRESQGWWEGCYSGVSPLHPAWIPAFAGMTIRGVCASLGWGFDTDCYGSPCLRMR